MTQKCEEEYGVRPVIVLDANEVHKLPTNTDIGLTISEVIEDDCEWPSEGGIANPYDKFFFDCERMVFTNVFDSPELSDTHEFNMKFVDDKTIHIDGVRSGYEIPAEIILINENRLRLRFIDYAYNDGDYYLNKVVK